MKQVIQSLSLFMVLFIPSIVCAGNIDKSSVDKLMELSGLNKQVKEYPEMVSAGLEQARQQGAPISDNEFNDVKKAIKGSIQPSEFLRIIGIEIKNNVTEGEMKGLLSWYESDLGRMFTQAEERASTSSAYQEMINTAQSLLADSARVNLAKKIDSLMNVTEMTMEIQNDTGLAVFTAISTIMNPEKSVNIEAFKAQVSAQKKQVRANIEQLVILSIVYSYKDIDVADIEKYIDFIGRQNTKNFNDSVMQGIKYAFNDSTNKMAKSLAAVFRKYKKS